MTSRLKRRPKSGSHSKGVLYFENGNSKLINAPFPAIKMANVRLMNQITTLPTLRCFEIRPVDAPLLGSSRGRWRDPENKCQARVGRWVWTRCGAHL